MERPSYDQQRSDYKTSRAEYERKDYKRGDYDQRDAVRRELPEPPRARVTSTAAAPSARTCPPVVRPARWPRSPHRRPAPVSRPRG
ncbi:hypothetical protein SHIRM173S_09674 [Streptomyces hirsutus]